MRKIFNFQFSIFKLAGVIFIYVSVFSFFTPIVFADSAIDNGITFLKGKQDVSGKITGGYSAPSQWSAIAFTIHGDDTASIKNPSVSLQDFLRTDIPTNDAATEWETRILAIVAIGENPANFHGTDYVTHLQSFMTNGQIGDTCALNDDIFGLLALIASGDLANTQMKKDILAFVISQQDSDGGYSWAAAGCSWYATSPDMTGAALQALQAAKEHGLIHAGLDDAITKAQNYLVTHQNSDGGFGSFGSDADTTGWALMGLNVLGMQDSTQANKAKTFLLNTQQSDGGFLSWGGTDSTTTANAVISLTGKGWLLHVYTATVVPSTTTTPIPSNTITPTVTPTMTPTTAPAPGLISVMQQIAVTVTPQPTTTSSKKSTKPVSAGQQVLGATTQNTAEEKAVQPLVEEKPLIKKTLIQSFGTKNILFFLGAGFCALLAVIWLLVRLRTK